MKKFTDFAKITDSKISDDVVIATTNHGNFSGFWTVGLNSESTHGGYRISGTPSSKEFDKSRGRYNTPSKKCLAEMVEHARAISR